MNIKEFTSRYNSKSTRCNYRIILNTFFKLVKSNPETYFKENRDYEKDIETFFQFRMKNNYAPKTINSDLGCLKIYFAHNRVDLPSIIWRDLRRRMGGSRARVQDKLPSQSDLKAILSHMNIRGRAFFLTMISSGMRINEVANIYLNDIYLDEDPVRIKVRGDYTKTKNSRTAFISQETKEAINEWMKVRDKYLKTVTNEKRYVKKNPIDHRLFPFGAFAARLLFNDALKNAGLEEFDNSSTVSSRMGKRGQRTIHPHSLRQYFRTRVGTVVSQDIAEALIGHEQGIVAVYARFQKGAENELSKLYKEKVESNVTIFSNPSEMHDLLREYQNQAEAIELQRDSLSHMAHRNLSLERKIGDLEDQNGRIAELEKKLAKMTNYADMFFKQTVIDYKEKY